MATHPGHYPGEISQAARATLLQDRARKLRILKYRMLFIFLLMPSLLVAAIVFDWIWELNLSGRLTRAYVIAIYGGLIALFVLAFLIIGYMIRKRMNREDKEALEGPPAVEIPPRAGAQPIPLPKVTKPKVTKPDVTKPINSR